MKKVLLILLIIVSIYFIKIPKYVELNNLAIIEGAGIYYNKKEYTIWLKEIIPLKEEEGINYEYHYYKGSANSLSKALSKIEKNTKKKLYFKQIKYLVTNLNNSKKISKYFHPKNIQHAKENIYQLLKESKES